MHTKVRGATGNVEPRDDRQESNDKGNKWERAGGTDGVKVTVGKGRKGNFQDRGHYHKNMKIGDILSKKIEFFLK